MKSVNVILENITGYCLEQKKICTHQQTKDDRRPWLRHEEMLLANTGDHSQGVMWIPAKNRGKSGRCSRSEPGLKAGVHAWLQGNPLSTAAVGWVAQNYRQTAGRESHTEVIVLGYLYVWKL
jgi:hypothetical protein